MRRETALLGVSRPVQVVAPPVGLRAGLPQVLASAERVFSRPHFLPPALIGGSPP